LGFQHTSDNYGLHAELWSENFKRREYLVDLDADGRKILKWILDKYFMQVWLRSNGIDFDPVAGFYEHDNECSYCTTKSTF
jgi:hypothetical protein